MAAPPDPDSSPPPPAPPATVPQLAIREHRPTDPRWRGDLLAPSSHGRLVPETQEQEKEDLRVPGAQPLSARGPGASAASATASADAAEPLAAALTREALGDFAPALLLLPATERTRARALLAYACTLMACAGQHGVEGERLARIDRWEAGLERALGGETRTPPICLRMARENARRRWPADALDDLAACARRRVLRPRPATAADAESDARSLARAAGGALLETSLNAEVSGFAGALVRLHALQHLGAALARGRCPLPADEGQPVAGEALGEAVQRECARLRPWLLRAPRGLVELPVAYRRAGVFSLLAALRLLADIEEAGTRVLSAPPHLPAATRIGLLARARWFGLRFGLP